MLLTNIRYYGSDHKFHEGEIRITAGRICFPAISIMVLASILMAFA